MLCKLLQPGNTFINFEEFNSALLKYEKENFCFLTNVDSKKIEVANKSIKGKLFDPKFRYSYIKLACKHAGQYKS